MTIIDPGPRTSSSEQEWLAAMEQLGFEFSDIASIVLTHHHPDHYGLAGWFQERSGAKVWMSERAHREAMLMWGTDSAMDHELPAFFRQHGMPETKLALLPEHLNGFFPKLRRSRRSRLSARICRSGWAAGYGSRCKRPAMLRGICRSSMQTAAFCYAAMPCCRKSRPT